MRKLMAFVVIAALAGCGSAQPTTTNRPPAPATTAPRAVVTPAPAAPSAYDQLAGFVSAAGALDGRLRAASQAINNSGPPWPQVPPAVNAAVSAAALGPVAAAIPAGLPADLLRQVVLVYSDLASRRFSIRWFESPSGAPYDGPAKQQLLLQSLANGAPAAARFGGDLADLVAEAKASPPVAVAAPTSRAAAEVLLLRDYVDGVNGGCASTGGQIVTSPPPIVWAPSGNYDGTIQGVSFTARLHGGAWQVQIWAC